MLEVFLPITPVTMAGLKGTDLCISVAALQLLNFWASLERKKRLMRFQSPEISTVSKAFKRGIECSLSILAIKSTR